MDIYSVPCYFRGVSLGADDDETGEQRIQLLPANRTMLERGRGRGVKRNVIRKLEMIRPKKGLRVPADSITGNRIFHEYWALVPYPDSIHKVKSIRCSEMLYLTLNHEEIIYQHERHKILTTCSDVSIYEIKSTLECLTEKNRKSSYLKPLGSISSKRVPDEMQPWAMMFFAWSSPFPKKGDASSHHLNCDILVLPEQHQSTVFKISIAQGSKPAENRKEKNWRHCLEERSIKTQEVFFFCALRFSQIFVRAVKG